MEIQKEPKGIIISQDRYNELLEKEIQADNNTYKLIMPSDHTYTNRYYYIYYYLQDVSSLQGTPGELLNKLKAALQEVKDHMTKYKERDAIESKRYNKLNDLYTILKDKLEIIESKWYYKLFNKK